MCLSDVENVNEIQFPLFLSSDYLECLLKYGDMLYIPPGFWYYGRSLTYNCLVNFLFKNRVNNIKFDTPNKVQVKL